MLQNPLARKCHCDESGQASCHPPTRDMHAKGKSILICELKITF